MSFHDKNGPTVSGGADRKESVKEQDQNVASAALAEPLFALVGAGYDLIPLAGKSPALKGWQTAEALAPEAAAERLANGKNVGVRLRETQVVIDWDPRADETGDALDRLMAEFKLEGTPRVETGGGGVHLYLTVPAGSGIANKTAWRPGIDVKTVGGQVVAPGSVHPETGKPYAFRCDPIEDTVDQAAPSALVAALPKAPVAERPVTAAGKHTADELEAMLEHLDPADYADNDRWLELAMACHHATAGAGEETFIAWSLGDGAYAHDEEKNRRRWRSLRSAPGVRAVTERTLYKALTDAGANAAIPIPAAADDFADVEPVDGLPPAPPRVPPLNSAAPMTVAGAMLEGKALVRCNGDWLRYDDRLNAYVEEEKEAFAARVWTWTDGRAYRQGSEEKRLVATTTLVSNVSQAASAQRQGPRDLPAWHPRRQEDPAPEDLLAVRNGLLNLATGQLLPPTARFVNRNASPVEYDPAAPHPARWTRFLAEVFLDDHETRDTLQEIVGYLLTQDTSQQKVFCVVGPMRCGKGTVNRVVQQLLGEGNYTSPTAASLSKGEFGLQPLIGKTLATISDMRMGRNTDPAALAENLLRISGEDEVSVNRKFKEPWEGRLSARFLILSNELPHFRDTSGAIISRLILIRSRVSFLGREDPALARDLRAELPGILNWALEGLARLRARGHFVQPASSRAEIAAMIGLASPVKAFAQERLAEVADAVTPKAEIWDAFNAWIGEEGLPYKGTAGHFFKDLKTVGVAFDNYRMRVEGERVQCVRGITILADD